MSECAICVLEPDEIEQEILEGILSSEENVQFFDAVEALMAALEANPSALVLLHTQFEEESGYELCRQIKSVCRLSGTNVLFLTEQHSVDERVRGLEVGADDYLFKPYDVIECATKIQAAKKRVTGQSGLKMQLDMASNTAMQAMSAQSEMGSVVKAMRSMYVSDSHEDAVRGLFACLSDYNLAGTIYFQQMDNTVYLGSGGREATPIEQQLIELTRVKERLWERDSRSIYNFQLSSLLILNMPEDQEQRGRFRDSLCIIMEAFDERVDSLNQQMQLTQARQWQSEVTEISQLLNVASKRLRSGVAESHSTLNSFFGELRELLPRLGLEEDQETQIYDLMDTTFEAFNAGLSETERTDSVFIKVMAKLDSLIKK